LEFDTALDVQVFAKLKLAHLITATGYLVDRDGTWTPWKPIGVRERKGTMRIWGSAFTGEGLDRLLTDEARKDQALDALRRWIRACLILEEAGHLPAPWPAGALIGADGAILFPPAGLLSYSLEAAGPEAFRTAVEQYVHPDGAGLGGTAFTAGAMLYRLFCAVPAFSQTNRDILLKDIREGEFLPLKFAVPGLDPDLARLIGSCLRLYKEKQGARGGALLRELAQALGPPLSAGTASYLHEVDPRELARLTREKERFMKRHARQVKNRRFIQRNAALIAGISLGVLALGLTVGSVISDRAKGPSTQGMEPQAVVQSYYEAMGTLNHQWMDVCVMPKIGRDDIDMVTQFFVITRVRQAYERTMPTVIPAETWIQAGAPPTEATVFGVSDLLLESLDQDAQDGEVSFAASYRLWLPGAFQNPDEPAQGAVGLESPDASAPPWNVARKDQIRLIQHRGAWRIAEIQRTR
jgi:hypothetical protein